MMAHRPEMEIHKLIGYCGLVCAGCPIYWATLEKDEGKKAKMRNAVARMCRERYGMPLNPEDVTDCDGCRAQTGRLFSKCVNCEIRKCARLKKIESCAFCGEYACERLNKFFETDPEARTRLEMIRNILSYMK
jgi:hypothetical protein